MKKFLIALAIVGGTLGFGGVAAAQDFSGGACNTPNPNWPGQAAYCAVYGPNGSYSKTYCQVYGIC